MSLFTSVLGETRGSIDDHGGGRGIPEIDALMMENTVLRNRQKELLERCSQLLEERRANSRRAQVAAFHHKYGHPVAYRPGLPDEKRIRFRMKLEFEEFVEELEALTDDRDAIAAVAAALADLLQTARIKIDLPALVDAWGDQDFVREGSRLEFGVDGEPIARLIYEANMTKGDNDPVTGKPRKNPDWKPPDIAGELRRQGERE